MRTSARTGSGSLSAEWIRGWDASGLDARYFAGCGEVCMRESGDGCGVNKADGGVLWLHGMTQAE